MRSMAKPWRSRRRRHVATHEVAALFHTEEVEVTEGEEVTEEEEEWAWVTLEDSEEEEWATPEWDQVTLWEVTVAALWVVTVAALWGDSEAALWGAAVTVVVLVVLVRWVLAAAVKGASK